MERSDSKFCPDCAAVLIADAARCACGHRFPTPNGRAPWSAIHTHYDNLKVSHDAPPEVIRAAYRALCSKYHPDHSAGDARSVQVMQLLNAAYEVLSDPARRQSHDRWIEQAAAERLPGQPSAVVAHAGAASAHWRDAARRADRRASLAFASVALVFAALAAGATAVYFRDAFGLRTRLADAARGPAPAPIVHGAPAQPSGYRRRPLAPNGMPWPETSGYVEGYARLRSDGPLAVVLDNSRNPADVFAKLVALDDTPPIGVRAVFLKAGDRFVIDAVRPGAYEVRYRNLDTGVILRSAPFDLAQAVEETPITPAATTIVLRAPRGVTLERPEAPSTDF